MTMFSTFHLPELPSLAPSPCQHSQKPGTSLPISQSNLLIEQQSSASNLKKNLSTNLIQSPTARGLTAPTVSVKLCQDTSFIVSYIILLHCLCLQFSFDHICVSPFPVSMEYSKFIHPSLNLYKTNSFIFLNYELLKQRTTTRYPATPKFVPLLSLVYAMTLCYQGPQVKYSPVLPCCPRPLRRRENASPIRHLFIIIMYQYLFFFMYN